MPRFRFGFALIAGLLSLAVDASAAGRWNMPSRTIQFAGVGYGAGYHAPMLLGPAYHARVANPGVQRLSAPLVVDCSVGSSCWQAQPQHLGPAADVYHPAPSYFSDYAPAAEYDPTLFPAPPLEDAAPHATRSEPVRPRDQVLPEAIPLPSANDRNKGQPRPARGWRW